MLIIIFFNKHIKMDYLEKILNIFLLMIFNKAPLLMLKLIKEIGMANVI